jgi:acetate kinase
MRALKRHEVSDMAILAVNAGSSSLKFSVYPVLDGLVQPSVLSGNIQGLEPQGTPEIGWKYQGRSFCEPVTAKETDLFQSALLALRNLLQGLNDLPQLQAIAHRVVHGGQTYSKSLIVTPQVLLALAKLNSLAPLHQPHNLAGIEAFQKAFPTLPQVACFDTAYHVTVPEEERQFALPQALTQQGIQRYGFHGLSYQYIMGSLQERSRRANGKVLMAHLGNGASLCMAQDGESRATTMGFSALDGLMMGTRSGSLDAGVLLYLLEQSWTHDQIQTLLYKQSGLLGVSGISADMRKLRMDHSPHAKWAIDLFTHRIVRECGALIACSQGLDVLAFSGGIGEHDALLRAKVCEQLSWLGVHIDEAQNQLACGDNILPIHKVDSAMEVWVIPTDEGRVAAREAAAVCHLS